MAEEARVHIRGTEDVSKAGARAGGAISKLKGAVKGAGQVIKDYGLQVTAAYLAVKKLADFALENITLAANADQIRRSLDNMSKQAGVTSRQVVDSLSKMAGGTVSEFNLMKSATRALLFDLPVDRLDELMQIARASATATGESVQKMFDDIVTGIARGSPMILDNLGITIKQEEAYQAMAKSLGKTSGALTAAEKKQAILNAVLAQGGDILNRVGEAAVNVTAAERWQRLTAAIEDARVELSTGFLPIFEQVTEAATKGIRFITPLLKDIPQVLSIVASAIPQILANTLSFDTIWKVVQNVGKAVIATLTLAWDKLPEIAWDRIKLLGEPFVKMGEMILSNIKHAWAKSNNWIAQNLPGIANIFGIQFDEAVPEAKKFSETWDEIVQGTVKNAQAYFGGLIDLSAKELGILADLGKDLAATVGDANKDVLDEMISKIVALQAQLSGGADSSPALALADGAEKAAAAYDEMISSMGRGSSGMQEWSEFVESQRKHAEYVESLKEKYEELEAALVSDTFQLARDSIETFGAALVDTENAMEGFKDVMKAFMVGMLRQLAEMAFAQAAIAAAAQSYRRAAMFAAAGAAALVAAGAINAMANGGVITEPVMGIGMRSGEGYLLGERGPELVTPMGRRPAGSALAAGGVTVTQVFHIAGNMAAEREWHEKGIDYLQYAMRDY